MTLAWFVAGILGPAGYLYSVIFYNTRCIDTMCFVYTCIISCQSHMYVRIYVNVWYPVCKRARMQADMLSNSMFSCRRSRDLLNTRIIIATYHIVIIAAQCASLRKFADCGARCSPPRCAGGCCISEWRRSSQIAPSDLVLCQ